MPAFRHHLRWHVRVVFAIRWHGVPRVHGVSDDNSTRSCSVEIQVRWRTRIFGQRTGVVQSALDWRPAERDDDGD